jgi:hypothetical protein
MLESFESNAMKQIQRGGLLLIAFVQGALAQMDTLRAYFPLHTGDLWEYEVDDYPTYPRYQIRNLGDTLMPNGRTYYHFSGSEGGFYRMDDSLRVFRYAPEVSSCGDSEYVMYDLAVSTRGVWKTCVPSLIGDTLPSYLGFVWFQPHVWYPRLWVFADTRMYCDAQVTPTPPDTQFCLLIPWVAYAPRRLAKGFGMVWKQFEGPADNLDGAIINGVRYGTITSVESATQPNGTELFQNYPNPFNPRTTIGYRIDRSGFLALKVFDILGREVTTLVNERREAGSYLCSLESESLGTGVCFVRLQLFVEEPAGTVVRTIKLTIMK